MSLIKCRQSEYHMVKKQEMSIKAEKGVNSYSHFKEKEVRIVALLKKMFYTLNLSTYYFFFCLLQK